jgi:uncharacterized protein YndB with AHSA1/START domain
MTVVDVRKDAARRTLTITSAFPEPVARVWQLWADPRLLERWWGPPTHPATVTVHDLRAGGRVAFHVTGPDGDRHHASWDVRAVDPPSHLAFDLVDPDAPPMALRVDLVADGGGTRMTVETTFRTDDDLALVTAMGFAEGMSAAIGQIDAVLRATP